ncbi:MAG: hypothetical protein IIU14_04355 [Ruminococcus sp.]|nr:hypothetical protein [Ruminococcus sp.]
MKERYSAPTIKVDILERADVVLSNSNPGSSQQSSIKKYEKENVYKDIMSFFISGDWFS